MANFRIIKSPLFINRFGEAQDTKLINQYISNAFFLFDEREIEDTNQIYKIIKDKENRLQVDAYRVVNYFYHQRNIFLYTDDYRNLSEQKKKQKLEYDLRKYFITGENSSIIDEKLFYHAMYSDMDRFAKEVALKLRRMLDQVFKNAEVISNYIHKKHLRNYSTKNFWDQVLQNELLILNYQLHEALQTVDQTLVRHVAKMNIPIVVYFDRLGNALYGTSMSNVGSVFTGTGAVFIDQFHIDDHVIREEFVHIAAVNLGALDVRQDYLDAVERDLSGNKNNIRALLLENNPIIDKFYYPFPVNLPSELRPELYLIRMNGDAAHNKKIDELMPNTMPFIDYFIERLNDSVQDGGREKIVYVPMNSASHKPLIDESQPEAKPRKSLFCFFFKKRTGEKDSAD